MDFTRLVTSQSKSSKSTFSKFQQYQRQLSFTMAPVLFLYLQGISLNDLLKAGKDFTYNLYNEFSITNPRTLSNHKQIS
jgi:hypothetical protein